MFETLISGKEFEHPIDCFCPDIIHTTVITINKGDTLEVTNECKVGVENR